MAPSPPALFPAFIPATDGRFLPPSPPIPPGPFPDHHTHFLLTQNNHVYTSLNLLLDQRQYTTMAQVLNVEPGDLSLSFLVL